jgi:hypothetical protein
MVLWFGWTATEARERKMKYDAGHEIREATFNYLFFHSAICNAIL